MRMTRSMLMIVGLAMVGATVMPAQPPARRAFRLEFQVTDAESATAISTRKYSLVGDSGKFVRLRAGAKVPYQTGGGTNYVDVGTNFDCKIEDYETAVKMECSLEISGAGSGSPPRIQSHRVEVSAPVPVDKATKLAEIDDPVTGRRIEITVTPRRL